MSDHVSYEVTDLRVIEPKDTIQRSKQFISIVCNICCIFTVLHESSKERIVKVQCEKESRHRCHSTDC